MLIFAGELLKRAEELLKIGMHPSEIIDGYERAFALTMGQLDKLVISTLPVLTEQTLLSPVQTAVSSKQFGLESFLARLIVKAACLVMSEKNPKAFHVDSIRIVKIMGGSLLDSQVIPGMVLGRSPESMCVKAERAKVAIYSCPVDIGRTETKGTVLLHGAAELMAFSEEEEKLLASQMQEIVDTGVKVIVTGGTFGDLALHFINRHGLLAVKVPSKFDLQRLCRVVGATASARLGPLTPEEIGYCEVVECVEMGGDRVTVFRQADGQATKTASIVLRGATLNHLEDVERAMDDGINTIKSLSRDPRLVPGAGSTEASLAAFVLAEAEKTPGLAQYGMQKFGESLLSIPKFLAENAGLKNSDGLMQALMARPGFGVDVDNITEGAEPIDVDKAKILDVYATKKSALHLATDAALSVLHVDSIIMSKPAGGPKPKAPGPQDDD